MSIVLRAVALCFASGLLLALAGCGTGEAPSAGSTSEGGSPSSVPLPTAAIKSPTASTADDEDEENDLDETGDENAAPAELKEGSPEWLVRESTTLRLQPSPETTDVEQLKLHRKKRNEEIIALCQKAVAQVHNDPEQDRLFTAAVRNMLEARLQLALAGDRDSIDTLYEDAAALFQRDPKSAAAAEAAHTLVNLAYSEAKAGGGEAGKWLEEFSRQAAHFAEDFPNEQRRALPLLFTAGRSCELGGLIPQARECYTLIQQKFPNSAYAPRVAAILRRLKLVGSPPQISGPTIDGDQIVLDDLLGQPVLVVFWSTQTKAFVDELPSLKQAIRGASPQGLQVIGVSLDDDAAAVSQFTLSNKIAWPQIFYSEPAQRGWNNPIVGYYGIMELPALWLIDQNGNVVSNTLTTATLPGELKKLLGAREEGGEAAAGKETTKQPVAGAQQKRSKSSAPPSETR